MKEKEGEGNTTGQVLKTDFAVCTYTLTLSFMPEYFIQLISNFFIDSKTTHYSDGAR